MKTLLRRFALGGIFFFLAACSALAQSGAPAGISPCSANSLSVSGVTGNVQLSNCGPSVVLMNIGTQELFYNVGQVSTTAATTSNYSLPPNTYIVITVPTNSPAGWYLAAITAANTTTLRITQGWAQ